MSGFDPTKLQAPIPGMTDGSTDLVFDPNQFMSMTTEGVGSTTITPIPAGEYIAVIGSDENAVKPNPFRDAKTGEARLRLDVVFDIMDDSGALRAKIDGRDPKITQGFFLDLIPGTFQLDMGKGKNIQLNRLREALGQNTGAAWGPPMLKGAGPVKLQITVQPDKQDPTIPRNQIKAFGKPAGLVG